jgi:hypothetical protein
MADGYGPAEFSEVLNSPERPLIVGGQAVNVWAEYFALNNAHLATQRPFVSKDADIYGNREIAAKLAAASGWRIKFFHEPRTIAVAVLTKDRPPIGTLTVEVLREVRGLTHKELADADMVELRPGQIYRIPSPLRLLKAKLANVCEIAPTRPQDINHVRLLVTLAHEYIMEQHAQVVAKRLPERTLINALHELRELASSPSAQLAETKAEVRLVSAIPTDLSTVGLPKLEAFYQHHGPPPMGPRISV